MKLLTQSDDYGFTRGVTCGILDNPVQSGKSPVSCRIFVSPPERENVLPFGENKILNYGNSNCGALQAQKTNWR